MMAVASPWSRVVVRFLTEQGVPVHIVDVNNSIEDRFHRPQTDRMLGELREWTAGVHLVELPTSLAPRLLLGALAVRRIAKRTNAQMILSLYGGMQSATAWLSGARPYAVYVVGSDVLLADAIRNFITRRSLQRASRVIANGAHLRDRTTTLVPGVPVELLYLGIDLTRFRPPAIPRATPAPLRFVCSRAFNPVYDNATIVRAVAALDSPPELMVEFLSTGPLLAETEALAASLMPVAGSARIDFAKGVSDDALLAALQGASYYISASLSDGASASLMEAMACGLFPIVSDIPANREWITHGRNGLLFTPGRPDALRECLESVISGIPWMAAAIAENASRVAQLADVDRNLQHLLALLDLERAPGAALEK